MRVALLIFLLALNSLAFGSQAPNTLSLKFEREAIQDNYTETVKGIAYYQSPKKVFIEVQEPISQIMSIDGDVMIIYYPVEKKAFRIKSKGPIPMPFIQTILSVMKDDYGLTEMGYTFAEHERKGDTLYTYWKPPKKLKKRLGKFVLGTASGLLVSAEARDPKGKPVAKSLYSKHTKLGEKYFPLEVRSEIYTGSNRSEENVTYSDVKFDISIPAKVTSFKIPDSVKVKEVEW